MLRVSVHLKHEKTLGGTIDAVVPGAADKTVEVEGVASKIVVAQSLSGENCNGCVATSTEDVDSGWVHCGCGGECLQHLRNRWAAWCLCADL